MDLRPLTAQALRWSLGARFATQIISWAATLFVIRLLQPEDYGIMAMVMSVMALADYVNEGGLAASVIQKQEINSYELGTVSTFASLISIVLFAIIFLLAPLVSNFYGEDISFILRVAALTVPLRSFGRIQEAILIRRFDFRSRALIETAAIIINAATTLCLAIVGFGIWALIFGALTGSAARALGFAVSSREKISANFDFQVARSHLKFSGAILGQRVIGWATAFYDIILLGHFFDPGVLGIYSTAKEVASLPQAKLAAVFNQVTFATFSRLQNDPIRVRNVMQRSIEMLSFTMFPVFFSVSAYAPEFQRIMLGAKWVEIVLPLQILAFIPPVRMINSHLLELLNGIGRPLASTSNLLLGIVILVCASFAGLHWGVLGVAVAAVPTFPVVTTLLMLNLVRSKLVSWEDLLLPLAGPFAASVVAWTTVMVLRKVLEPVLPIWQVMIILGSAGPVSYLMLMTLIAPRRLREVISYIRA